MELQIHKITDGSMPSETIVSDPTEADVIKAIEEILDYTADATSEKKKRDTPLWPQLMKFQC